MAGKLLRSFCKCFSALRLVQIRGEAMQMAGEMCRGGMATIFYGPDSKLGEACIKAKQWASDKGDPYPECTIASYMYPHCKVIAGSTEVSKSLS